MSNAIVPFNDIERMALAVSKSQLFGMKTPDQAIALMLVAQSEGLHPARAAMEYHVIQGRPALKADAMLARFQAAGGKVEWKDYTDTKVVGVFSHPAGGSISVEWSIEMATKAGLTKNPTWRQYPRQMLRARCISEGIRTVYPGVSVGVYTPEEVQDFAPQQQPERDITQEAHPVPMPEKVKQAASAKRQPVTIEAAPQPVRSKPAAPARGTISGDPMESDLSDIAPPDPTKPSAEQMSKLKDAFAKQLNMTPEMIAHETGFGPIEQWTIEQFEEAREVFKALKIERAAMAAPSDDGAV